MNLEEAAAHLALHVEAAWRALGDPAPEWSYAGGLFRSPFVLAGVAARLGRPPIEPALPPIGGSLLRAARQAGWAGGGPISGTWLARLKASLASHLDA